MNDKTSHHDVQKAIEEILSGKGESATALSLEAGRHRPLFPSLKHPLIFRILMFTAILLFIIGMGIITYFKLFSENSSKMTATTIIEQVQELATLTTADAVVTTVIKKEDNKLFDRKININLPGTKRIALIIVPANVLAGVDLKSLTEKNVQIDEKKKKISLKIPHATIIQEPSIQMDKVQTYSEEGIFRHEVNWDEGFDLASMADKQIKKEAIDMGLLTKADDNAVKALSHFFEIMGYKSEITFQ